MPLLSSLAQRILAGTAARSATKYLSRRFNLSPATANIVFLILTGVIAWGAGQMTRPPKRA